MGHATVRRWSRLLYHKFSEKLIFFYFSYGVLQSLSIYEASTIKKRISGQDPRHLKTTNWILKVKSSRVLKKLTKVGSNIIRPQ